jgi:hypothetical protein
VLGVHDEHVAPRVAGDVLADALAQDAVDQPGLGRPDDDEVGRALLGAHDRGRRVADGRHELGRDPLLLSRWMVRRHYARVAAAPTVLGPALGSGKPRIENTCPIRAADFGRPADHTGMAERDDIHEGDKAGRAGRVDRHRIAREKAAAAAAAQASPPAPPAPAPPAPAAAPAPAPAPRPKAVVKRAFPTPLAPALKDKTRGAVRRPALLSDRCVSCGASTKHLAGMVTELVEVGPIRALRVVACSECPDRRRRGLTGL